MSEVTASSSAGVAAAHLSVLKDEIVTFFGSSSAGICLDCTLGAGGHSEALLEAGTPTGRVYAVDRDPTALAMARERLARFGARFVSTQLRFSKVCEWARGLEDVAANDGVDGLLADFGVSSMQFDTADRGFSIRFDGPLDMRMGDDGPTAGEVIDSAGEADLTRMFRDYSDMRDGRRLARAIKAERAAGRLTTTHQLAELCSRVAGRIRSDRVHPATLVFQALRIAVNDEVGEIEALLRDVPSLLAPGGVAAFISFHSIEDRLVKRAIRSWTTSSLPPGLPVTADEDRCDFEVVSKVVQPSETEVSLNPRARSSKLRVVRRKERGQS